MPAPKVKKGKWAKERERTKSGAWRKKTQGRWEKAEKTFMGVLRLVSV